jgi:hypothetical protein
MFRRKGAFDPVGPLDQADALAFEILVNAEIEKLTWPLEAIGVEVVDRQAGVVFLDQHEGGAADDTAIGNLKAFRDGPDKVCLSGAKRTDQGDHCPGEKGSAKPTAETLSPGQVADFKL